uniref:Small ribosomal subunit protein eS8 n=1 Tax=Fervidicoccus fontis TaxID=683846 RepID=A0A7J3ZKC0_9CREN
MGVYQGRDSKKPSGGLKRRPYKVKRKYELGRFPTNTQLSTSTLVVRQRVRGGNCKLRLKRVDRAVVADPRTGGVRVEKILKILETPANREYARRGIIVKGTIIQVESGKAIVVSRPGQDGVVNAVLQEKS